MTFLTFRNAAIQELYDEFEAFLQTNFNLVDGTPIIDEQLFNASPYAAMPVIPDSLVDELIDLAAFDPEVFEHALKQALKTYRIFRTPKSHGSPLAVVNIKALCLQALLRYPQDDQLLSAIFAMGRCTGVDDRGKRCKRRAVADRCCAEHGAQVTAQ